MVIDTHALFPSNYIKAWYYTWLISFSLVFTTQSQSFHHLLFESNNIFLYQEFYTKASVLRSKFSQKNSINQSWKKNNLNWHWLNNMVENNHSSVSNISMRWYKCWDSNWFVICFWVIDIYKFHDSIVLCLCSSGFIYLLPSSFSLDLV